ncbi:uncharacterized threonine-rich GPI-anchored glycoprotein PJ4664.02 isoform X2 [Eurytemora carolleeae]|uniref:uncharacterized threonine-rich GPI-anchored glycoprotein PJ4664.02 isoform X2 n=1 Tax=Eurytemora carolleeae TaxID=1294199 RepID=UPI000C77179F|nr:uncharacterized threonine-rich GPI-anchored glycoprotein PJ4664.02 isoform X2 [Eurytemora carolleeae]|eukprot:XP_023344389.1 uncharacterized threonine-rich GPI-anchored glycoprotein PJ4664.02-like isoform X2 [Eurytemora affinis]
MTGLILWIILSLNLGGQGAQTCDPEKLTLIQNQFSSCRNNLTTTYHAQRSSLCNLLSDILSVCGEIWVTCYRDNELNSLRVGFTRAFIAHWGDQAEHCESLEVFNVQDEDNKDQVERIECTDIESGNIMTEYSECTHMYTSQVYNAVTRLSHGTEMLESICSGLKNISQCSSILQPCFSRLDTHNMAEANILDIKAFYLRISRGIVTMEMLEECMKTVDNNSSQSNEQSSTEETGLSRSIEETGLSSSTEETGLSSSTEETGLPSSTEETGLSSSTEETGLSSSTEETGLPSSIEKTGLSSSTEETGLTSSIEETGLSSSTEETGLSSSTEETGLSSSTEETGFPSSIEIDGLIFGLQTSTPISGLQTSTPISGLQTSTPISGLQTSTPISGLQTSTPISGLQSSTQSNTDDDFDSRLVNEDLDIFKDIQEEQELIELLSNQIDGVSGETNDIDTFERELMEEEMFNEQDEQDVSAVIANDSFVTSEIIDPLNSKSASVDTLYASTRSLSEAQNASKETISKSNDSFTVINANHDPVVENPSSIYTLEDHLKLNSESDDELNFENIIESNASLSNKVFVANSSNELTEPNQDITSEKENNRPDISVRSIKTNHEISDQKGLHNDYDKDGLYDKQNPDGFHVREQKEYSQTLSSSSLTINLTTICNCIFFFTFYIKLAV